MPANKTRELDTSGIDVTGSLVTGQTDTSHAADVRHSDRGFRQKTEWVYP